MNPFDALANFGLGILKQRVIQDWCKLIFSIAFSGGVGFVFTCGAVLVAPPHSWAMAIGSGQIIAGVCMTAVFRASPLTKGLLVVLPSAEAAKEIETDLQTIQRSK